MNSMSVTIPDYDQANEIQFGPATIEKRTDPTGLKELGTSFMVFHGEDFSDPWKLQYEETIYVISGEARLIVLDDDGSERILTAGPDQLLVLPKGSTVRYGAPIGTRLLLSISPVDWRDRI